MRALIICGIVWTLAGCTSLQNAGTASYRIKPFELADGKLACCELEVLNGKEITGLEARITKTGDDFTIELKEQGVKAFKGHEISAEAMRTVTEAAVKAALTGMGVAAP